MIYIGPDQQLHDDGYGMQTAPAYGLSSSGERYELGYEQATELTRSFQASFQSRLPLGDAVARMTKAVGIQSLFRDSQGSPCSPCQARQAAMNRFGDRVAAWWSR
jgi:hypothetical protein